MLVSERPYKREKALDRTVCQETPTVLYITVDHESADDIASEYGFSDEQKRQMEELLDSSNQSLWASVLYGIRAGENDIVQVALSQVNQVGGQPY